MSQIQPYSEDLYKKYAEYLTKDEAVSDVKKLSPEQKELVDLALNTSFLNPKFKMKHFVTSGQITPYSTVRQWLIELKTMEENCENFEHLLRKFELERKIATMRMERTTDELEKAEHQLALNKINFDESQAKRRLAQHYIEREQYIQLLFEYLDSPNGKTPEGKSWLSVFGDMDEENKWEAHYWTVRLAQQAAMDLTAYGRVGSGNMEAITQLPPELQEEAMAVTHEVSLRLESFSGAMREKIHHRLIETDPAYAAMMAGKRADDLNKVEFNVNDLAPIKETPVNGGVPPSDEDLVNVYNN